MVEIKMNNTDRKELKEGYVKLHDHFEQVLAERSKYFEEKFRASQIALDLASSQMDKRLEGMNEFQKRMDRLEGTFATKAELKGLEKLVYVGIGILVAVQFIIAVFGVRIFGK